MLFNRNTRVLISSGEINLGKYVDVVLTGLVIANGLNVMLAHECHQTTHSLLLQGKNRLIIGVALVFFILANGLPLNHYRAN